MSYLTVEEQDDILVVTLDQPGEKVNKLNEELIAEFEELLPRAEEENIKGIVLISGKEDNFIAGADVKMLQKKQAPDEIEELSRTGNFLLMNMENFPKPIVAAIHGGCIGGGNEVAMACHYRVATEDSATKFSQPEVQLRTSAGRRWHAAPAAAHRPAEITDLPFNRQEYLSAPSTKDGACRRTDP